ncbi:GAF domain-like [Phytophthora cactorum]|nr:GAF domain-like [Phytophthora cactorum]
MVTKINHFLRMDGSEKAKGGLHFIGILDIFGFEVFPKNSFEQLCINFANETLQQQFNDYVFKAEQREYESQGVDWKYIEFCDNQDSSKLYRACGSHPRFEASRIQRARGLFTVVHYAGHVEYSSDGFLEKNKDVLHQEAVDMLVYSTREDSFTRVLCEGFGGSRDRAKSSPRQRAQTSKNRGASVGLQFKEQLTTLLETLQRTNPHYVRCLKPNEQCKAGIYERERVLNQLRCNGVMEAVRVARAGYPIRLPHDVFVARYFSLKRSKNPLLAKKQGTSFGLPDTDSDEGMAVISSEAKELLKELLDVIPKENDANPQGACERPDQGQFATKCISVGIQMGFTKMFMKKPTYEFLEEMRSQRLHRHMIKIFYAVLCVTARARYLRYLHAVKTLQIRFRYKKLQKLRRRRLVMMIRKRNAGKVQGFIRTVVQRRKFVRFLAVVRMLQCRFKFRRRMRAKRTEADRARKLANLKREQQLQAVTQYTESSTASSDSSPRSVTSHSNDIEGSGFSDASSDYSDDMFTYNDNFPKHNLNTVDEQSSQLMPRASHRVSLRKSQSIDSITPMGGFRASQMHNTHGSQGQMVHTPGSRSRLPSRKSSFRNTRSSRAVALPRLDVIQHTSWVNDEDRFSCHICNKRFNVFKRKHHCRACGEVICNSCSLYHRIQSRSMRVCVSCCSLVQLQPKTSNGSAPDRNRSSTLSSGMWLNPWPEPPYPVDEEERLTVLRELNIRELGLSGKFNMYCEVAAKTMKCPIAYVSIIEDEEQLLVANIGMAHTTLPRELSFCAHTICQPSVLVVLDTKNDERFRENPMVKGDKGAVKIRYYAGATIFSRDGHALGTVAVLDTKPRREADQEHIGMLQHLSFLASEKMTQSTIHEDNAPPGHTAGLHGLPHIRELRGAVLPPLIRFRYFSHFGKRLKLAPHAPRVSVKLPPKIWWSRKASLQPETVEARQVLLNEYMQQVCTRPLTPRSQERLMKLLQVGDYAPKEEEDRVINSRLSSRRPSTSFRSQLEKEKQPQDSLTDEEEPSPEEHNGLDITVQRQDSQASSNPAADEAETRDRALSAPLSPVLQVTTRPVSMSLNSQNMKRVMFGSRGDADLLALKEGGRDSTGSASDFSQRPSAIISARYEVYRWYRGYYGQQPPTEDRIREKQSANRPMGTKQLF